MSINLDISKPRELTEAINLIPTVPNFFLDRFFSNTAYHNVDTIDYEIFTGKEGLAYFGRDGEKGKSISKASRVIKSLKIPLTKESKTFTAKELAAFKSLSELYASAQVKAKFKADYIANELQELKDRIYRRREFMAAQALTTGLITASQDDIDFSIDLEYTTDASTGQKYSLVGGSKWTDNGVDPLGTIKNYKRIIAKRSGMNVTDIVLGGTASDTFTANTLVMDALHNNNYKIGAVDLNGKYQNGVIWLGKIFGIDIWEYTGTYIATDGSTVTDIVPAGMCLMVANNPAHLKLHRAGIDLFDAQGNPTQMADDVVVQKVIDHYGQAVDWVSQQKSLPVVHNKNLVYAITVV